VEFDLDGGILLHGREEAQTAKRGEKSEEYTGNWEGIGF
jgi:hypothetical protein